MTKQSPRVEVEAAAEIPLAVQRRQAAETAASRTRIIAQATARAADVDALDTAARELAVIAATVEEVAGTLPPDGPLIRVSLGWRARRRSVRPPWRVAGGPFFLTSGGGCVRAARWDGGVMAETWRGVAVFVLAGAVLAFGPVQSIAGRRLGMTGTALCGIAATVLMIVATVRLAKIVMDTTYAEVRGLGPPPEEGKRTRAARFRAVRPAEVRAARVAIDTALAHFRGYRGTPPGDTAAARPL